MRFHRWIGTILAKVTVFCIVFIANNVVPGMSHGQVPEANVQNAPAIAAPGAHAPAMEGLIDLCARLPDGTDPQAQQCSAFLERIFALEAERLEQEVAGRRLTLEIARVAAEHRNAVLQAQARQTQVFFYLTLALLALGMLASLAHFVKAMRGSEDTSLEIAMQKDGVRLKTSMIGFLILLASMAFYTAYLYAVYPVSAIG